MVGHPRFVERQAYLPLTSRHLPPPPDVFPYRMAPIIQVAGGDSAESAQQSKPGRASGSSRRSRQRAGRRSGAGDGVPRQISLHSTAATGQAALGRIDPTSSAPDHLGMQHLDLTVYHDGSCPLCRKEIAHYRRQRGSDRIEFIDVSDPDVDPGRDLPRQKAMGRFHVRLPSGELRSGAAAFVEIWKVLPRWRPLARVAGLPGATPALDVGYRLSSPLRPLLARVIRHVG